jgi:GNAT superfamily N-acetyltransferase
VHPNDRRRVVRALELAEAGSSLAGDALWGGDTRRPTVVFGLDAPDAVLEQRIRARAAAMLERGVVEEARAALARPLSRSARKVMGLLDFAQLPSDEAREALVANNRRLARYQRKWMRPIPGLIALDANRAPDEIAADILGIARSRGMLGRVIRQVRTEDWERLRDVRLRALASDPGAFLETHADASTFPDERWQERATPDGTHSSFVLEQDGRFDGLVSCFFGDDPATAFLVAMWVAPELRGTGGARGLVERVIEWAREHRAGRVCLSVEPDNPRAARLYEKCGFVETDDPPTFPYQPNEDNRFFIFEL